MAPAPEDGYAHARAAIERAERELATFLGDGEGPPSAAGAEGRSAPPPRAVGRSAPPPADPPRSAPSAADDEAPATVSRGPSGRGAGASRRRAVGGVAIMLAFVPVGLVGSAALAGGGGGGGPLEAVERLVAPQRPTPPSFDPGAVRGRPAKYSSVVARVPAGRVKVHRRPGGRVERRLRATRVDGKRLPLVLLVKQRRRGWLQVYLPTRPNLSKGWIRRGAARLRLNPYRVKVELGRHRITVWRGKQRIRRARIGVGRALTPTPLGQYYVTDLLRPPDPGGTYGAFAFGLSGHSPVLTDFAGGRGQLGLHGTNQPGGLGTDVSAGCIRVSNRVIRALARELPLGTPVAIRS